ncbi:hypothetical protein ACFX15_001135 [Malus domestica]
MSLFASKSTTTGDCVLKVPCSVQLAPDNLVPELKDLLSDGVGDAAKLAAVVLFEQRMGNDFGWAPLHSPASSPGGDALHGECYDIP